MTTLTDTFLPKKGPSRLELNNVAVLFHFNPSISSQYLKMWHQTINQLINPNFMTCNLKTNYKINGYITNILSILNITPNHHFIIYFHKGKMTYYNIEKIHSSDVLRSLILDFSIIDTWDKS